jgi:hypothetical protein
MKNKHWTVPIEGAAPYCTLDTLNKSCVLAYLKHTMRRVQSRDTHCCVVRCVCGVASRNDSMSLSLAPIVSAQYDCVGLLASACRSRPRCRRTTTTTMITQSKSKIATPMTIHTQNGMLTGDDTRLIGLLGPTSLPSLPAGVTVVAVITMGADWLPGVVGWGEGTGVGNGDGCGVGPGVGAGNGAGAGDGVGQNVESLILSTIHEPQRHMTATNLQTQHSGTWTRIVSTSAFSLTSAPSAIHR